MPVANPFVKTRFMASGPTQRLAATVATTIGLLTAACAPLGTGSAAERVEPGELSQVVADSRGIDGLESLAVWYRGELMAEEYLVGDADTPRDVRSVTKSVTSLLVGIAISDGDLQSIDQTVGELIPDVGEAHGSEKADLRIRDLLTMSAGLEWREDELDEYLDWRRSADPIGYYLARPVTDEPGARFSYSSASSHLLGQLVASATGSPIDEYADDRLFRPLAIDGVGWERLSDGSANAASAMKLRTMDLVTIGRLVLDDGRVDGQPVVGADWIEMSTRPQIETGEGSAYGFHWWVEDDPVRFVVASGYGGQTLAVAPDHDLVIAATAAWNIPADEADRQSGRIVTYLRDQLGPALLAIER